MFISKHVLSLIPVELYPIIILVIAFLLFGAQLRFLYLRIEKGVVFLSGVVHKTDKYSDEISTVLHDELSYDDVVYLLEKSRKNKIPLAEELEDVSDEARLSFQLLHLAKSAVPTHGLRGSILGVVQEKVVRELKDLDKRNKLQAQLSNFQTKKSPLLPNVKVNWFHAFSGVMSYLVVCALYVGIVPAGSVFLGEKPSVTWPSPEESMDLGRSVLETSLATILPLVLGIVFFAKRRENVEETKTQALVIVFSIVFFISLVVNFLVLVLKKFLRYIGEASRTVSTSEYFLQFPEFVYLFAHSLIPGLAVVAISLVDADKILSRRDVGFGVGIVTGGHLLAYLAFELAGAYDIKFYWHQGLLGLVLSAAALFVFRVFWAAPMKSGSAD